MHIIFAITDSTQSIYKEFAEYIGQKDNVGLLPTKAGSAVTDQNRLKDLIAQQYDSIKRMYI